MPAKRVRIGISSCLLGEEVRFDGGHKRNSFLTDTLEPHAEWVRVCPEVELGLGVPRETLRLVRVGADVRMITTRTNIDHTDAMRAWARKRVEALAALGLDGYVLKKDSPSCGMERVKVFNGTGPPSRAGVGTFAAVLKRRFPALPIEEEGRLDDPALRENFLERVFAYRRLRGVFEGRWKYSALVEFHTRQKLSMLAHSTTADRDLGRLVASGRRRSRAGLRQAYESAFMAALSKPATRARHTTVLQHIAGFFKNQLDAASKAELIRTMEDYRAGLVPLVVPVTLLRHYVRVYDVKYLAGQAYLEPHPRELMLRNHV